MAIGYWSTASGPAASRAIEPASTSGRASSHRAPSSGAGSGTTPSATTSSGAGTREELAAHGEKLDELRERARSGMLTLVYGARDTEHNDAVVLAEVLRSSAHAR